MIFHGSPNKTRPLSMRLRLLLLAGLFIIVLLARWIMNKTLYNYQLDINPVAQLAEDSSVQDYSRTPHVEDDGHPIPQVGVSLDTVHDVVLWTSPRRGDINIYRIPVLTYTPDGNLVAIVEGRRKSEGDVHPKIFAVRRSTDGGETWSPSQKIVDDDFKISSYIGTVFVDDTTKTIFLMYAYCEFCPLISMMLMNSTDDGITWGRPRNITDMIGKDYAAYPGPGYGIQKKHDPAKGRLVVCGHGFYNGKGLVLLLSDDHGVTWRHGAFVPSVPFTNGTTGDFDPDECQPVELPDGSIYVVARNEKVYKRHCKIIMRSFDGGETLPQNYTYLDGALIEPRITSGLWYRDGTMFYSGPKHDTQRRYLYIRWSHDYGKTWRSEKQIWSDWAGYSTLMMLPQDRSHLYIMYERGTTGPVDEIAVTKIEIDTWQGREAT
ncbi:sialidase-1-like isoform X2 [Branchiostoma lanceolatum]|uniref:sialidase-1-like isoform X2 n=1 Tax=Branchiostoma lanceolatum TaxID=7740 RepID=UPI003456C87B